MRVETLVTKRFAELEARIDEIRITAYGVPHDVNVNSPMVKRWGTSVLNLLGRGLGQNSIHFEKFRSHFDKFSGYNYQFEHCVGIFLAAKDDYEGGYLFSITSLAKAEAFEDALEQAGELLRAGYKDPACVVVGVALESTIKELCTREGIPHAKLDAMNVGLRKAGKYNLSRQKQVTAWADLRNNAAHGKGSEYNDAAVQHMLEGVRTFIAECL